MADEVKVRNSGMGLASWLTVLFVGLKLTHYIDWSWWWVLSPLWISFGVGMVFFAVALLIAAIAAALK